LVLSLAVFADTIRLKDGSIIKGKIKTFTSGKFVVTIGDGSRRRELSFDASEVQSIEFDERAVPVSASNMSRVVEDQPIRVDNTAADTQAPTVIRTDTTGAPITREPAAPVTRPSSSASVKPIELSVRVLADNTANGWTNSGWVVKKGQRIRIIGEGEVSLGRGKTTSPSGLYELEDTGKLLKAVPTGALIAVIGDDNNDFIYIGAEREFTATRDGALFLGLNEGNLNDNSGSFSVRIEIRPDGSE
jgi:hypothetical protein